MPYINQWMKKWRGPQAACLETETLLRSHIVTVGEPGARHEAPTLAAALGEMLSYAEERFGPRDPSYTLLGVEFTAENRGVWFPGNGRQMIIQLDRNALCDREDAYRQLAHETVHLLSPTGRPEANVLEEGLAVCFEKWYLEHTFGEGWWSGTIRIPCYANAHKCAQELLCIDPGVIKRLRQEEPVLSRITADLLCQHCPAIPAALAFALAQPF